ncbi:hypothetical protein Tco_0489245 [Tanacetum coccineum]
MAPNRSKSLYAIKECSTCGSWYTKECCSIGNLNDQIIVPVPNSSLHCAVCGTPVDGPYCHGCTLIRKKFDEDLLAYCVDNGVFQNFQDTSESSNGHLPPNIKQVVEEEQTQPEYLQELLQSLLKDLQILNEIQPLRQETSNQIQKDQEEKSIAELLAEERLQKANQALNESQSPQEMRIQDLEIQKQHLDKSMSKHWKCGIIYKKQKSLEESEARARSQKIIIDDDDDIWGFYAVHPNTIHTFVSQNVEPKDSLIMGDGQLSLLGNWRHLVLSPLLAHLAPISPGIVEACVDDDDTDDDDDYEDDVYDCVDIEEDGGEIDLDISKIYRDSGEDTTSIDALPLDDSMILSEYESFTFDDEPVMAEVNVFDEINTSELSYPGIGENVVLDEEEDTFTFTTRSFLPFVTYPEVLPTSYSTGSEDKIFNPGIFDNVLTRKSSLTLDVFDPLHPPLMDFHVFRILEDSWFNIVEEQSNAHNFH